jgi:release factor glutamine methyltransferase
MGEAALQGAASTMRQSFVAAARLLRKAGIGSPELDARLLLCHAAGINQEAYVADPERTLLPDEQAMYGRLIERRLDGEPVSRILGRREFYGRSFLVDRHTLDPRPETETLVEATLAFVARKGAWGQKLRLLDLGTGTGCLLLTLLAELEGATGVGTDVSAAALWLAGVNARDLGVEARARFVAGDWLDAVAWHFDLVVANPPYLTTAEIGQLPREVGRHDPLVALDGGPDGLKAYRRIAARAGEVLQPGGAILLEIGPTQADAVIALLRAAGLTVDAKDGLWHDLAGRPRVVRACA